MLFCCNCRSSVIIINERLSNGWHQTLVRQLQQRNVKSLQTQNVLITDELIATITSCQIGAAKCYVKKSERNRRPTKKKIIIIVVKMNENRRHCCCYQRTIIQCWNDRDVHWKINSLDSRQCEKINGCIQVNVTRPLGLCVCVHSIDVGLNTLAFKRFPFFFPHTLWNDRYFNASISRRLFSFSI